jgi:hypothetical protein
MPQPFSQSLFLFLTIPRVPSLASRTWVFDAVPSSPQLSIEIKAMPWPFGHEPRFSSGSQKAVTALTVLIRNCFVAKNKLI